jgi:hypothetical protein
MDIVETTSATPQPPKVVGPTVTLLNTNERVTNQMNEDETVTTVYQYTQYRFEKGEYELAQVGILPDGAHWDDVLRSIERGALYDEADKYISKYTTDVPDADARQAWVDYKHAVRQTQTAQGYPAVVIYPPRPGSER